MSITVSQQVRSPSLYGETLLKEADSLAQPKNKNPSSRSWLSLSRLWGEDDSSIREIDTLKSRVKDLTDQLAEARNETASARNETANKTQQIAKLNKSLEDANGAYTPEKIKSIVLENLPSVDNFEQLCQGISEQNRKMGALLADFDRDRATLLLQARDAVDSSQQLSEQFKTTQSQLADVSRTLANNAKFQAALLNIIARLLKEKADLTRTNVALIQEQKHLIELLQDQSKMFSCPNRLTQSSIAFLPSAPPMTPSSTQSSSSYKEDREFSKDDSPTETGIQSLS